MSEIETKPRWRFKGPEMEGMVARWYAKVRSSEPQIAEYRRQALQLTNGLSAGAKVLEVAPGPGYLAIEMARLGRVHVTGLDISRTFVQIASEKARQAGVSVDFHQGDSAVMPFAAESFDLIVCQAAFKNFSYPESALSEMHRVLRGGGTAVIQDMNRDATHADIALEVKHMKLGRLTSFTTKATLESLRRRAYSPAQFERLVVESPFRTGHIRAEGIGLDIRLTKAVNL
ncbi:MAG: class I SAM-dependent methyltransferase [Chloroflexi bacterium]|nr:MAG: class I SAM-dependent methyltransferase [Chloroflexota bacterium]